MSKNINKNMLSFVAKEVRSKEIFAVDGLLFKIVKILFWVVAAYSLMACVAIMIGNWVLMDEFGAQSTTSEVAAYNEQRTYLITMLITSLSIIACYVILKLRKAIPFVILGCVYCVVSFTMFYGVSVQNDIRNGGQTTFWAMFGAPSIIFSILVLGLGAIMFVDKIKVKVAYEKTVSKLYDSATEGGTKKVSLEEFEEIMNQYKGQEIFRTDIPLKKSQRRRKRKQELSEK